MSSITVVRRNNQLVVDSRLIAIELGVEHGNLYETIKKYQTEIEQDFGSIPFQTESRKRENGGGVVEKFCYLTEEQATYVMTLSRNTDQVRLAKRNLVKAFSAAKQQLEQTSAISPDMAAAIMSRLANIDKNQAITHEIVVEYVNIRKYADNVLPGYAEITDAIIDSRMALPPVVIHFTAPQWVKENAPHLTQRQCICFYKEIAGSHRFLVDLQPEKINGTYWYTNQHEILFNRTLKVVETMIPEKSVVKRLSPVYTYSELTALSEDEQALVGGEMKLNTLTACLGRKLAPSELTKLSLEIKPLVRSGLIDRRTAGNKPYVVNPVLINAVKKFVGELA